MNEPLETRMRVGLTALKLGWNWNLFLDEQSHGEKKRGIEAIFVIAFLCKEQNYQKIIWRKLNKKKLNSLKATFRYKNAKELIEEKKKRTKN